MADDGTGTARSKRLTSYTCLVCGREESHQQESPKKCLGCRRQGTLALTSSIDQLGESRSIEDTVAERGARYGDPTDHFSTTQKLYSTWLKHRNSLPVGHSDKELAIRHAVYMICDKLARAAHDVDYVDNLHDIQGYAKCWEKIIK